MHVQKLADKIHSRWKEIQRDGRKPTVKIGWLPLKPQHIIGLCQERPGNLQMWKELKSKLYRPGLNAKQSFSEFRE